MGATTMMRAFYSMVGIPIAVVLFFLPTVTLVIGAVRSSLSVLRLFAGVPPVLRWCLAICLVAAHSDCRPRLRARRIKAQVSFRADAMSATRYSYCTSDFRSALRIRQDTAHITHVTHPTPSGIPLPGDLQPRSETMNDFLPQIPTTPIRHSPQQGRDDWTRTMLIDAQP